MLQGMRISCRGYSDYQFILISNFVTFHQEMFFLNLERARHEAVLKLASGALTAPIFMSHFRKLI